MTTGDLAQFNPFDAETLQCPYPHYAVMREEAPVLFLEQFGMYLVTRHDLVLSILRDPTTFSSKFGRPTHADERRRRRQGRRGLRRGLPAGVDDADH